jgi:phosphoglycolate phosphatase
MIHVFSPIPVERLKLLVFDLDGTLIDSAQDLCNSVNAALAHVGRAPLADHAIAAFVGNGAPMLVRRSLAAADHIPVDQVDADLQARTYAFFLDYYRAHKLDFTYAYEGVLESLHALHALHIADIDAPTPSRAMAVLTNKPVRPARGICEGLGLAGYFLHIYGGDSFPLKKPDPLGLRTLMNQVDASPEETAMIGDSQVDIQTARNAGVWSVGCTFGFGNDTITAAPPENRPDILVDSPRDWTAALSPAALIHSAPIRSGLKS